MLDRESTFADPPIVKMLQADFVPVAIDQAYQRRQEDTEGELYRKIAGQGPRKDFGDTTQGFYIATPAGKLLEYNNNRDPAKLRRLMRSRLAEFRADASERPAAEAVERRSRDRRYDVEPPDGGLVVRARARILGGYEPTSDRWRRIFQTALSRDNLWATREEHEALVRGELPSTLVRRMARFHLVDNTRGEPPMWKEVEVRQLEVSLTDGELRGRALLRTEDGARGYEADLRGFVEARDGRVVRFDVVARGEFWGEGPYTRGAPKGRFPLAVAFTLADGSDVADAIPPQGSRGWVAGYLR